MSIVLDRQRLEMAFQGRPDIIGAIQQAAAAPNWIELFNEISSFVSDLRNSSTSEPASKKRKIEEAIPNHSVANGSTKEGHVNPPVSANGANHVDEPALLRIKDISLVIPQRKKFTLEFTSSQILARHPETNEAIQGVNYAWKDIAYAFCLPVPEKTQKQHNYILFPKQSNITTSRSTQANAPEPLVFTIPATAPKPGTISGSDAPTASSVSDSYQTLFDYFLSRHLKSAHNNVSIVEPNEKHFASVIKESHRPNERAVHVKGFRGSKDGFLFFLSTGILWGFKKPLLFLPKEQIAAVSYTSVLQRTFNLNVEVHVGTSVEDEENEEFEFAMLDQEDFPGIDTYVKRNGLQDQSMAEQRRAKRLGVNVVKGEDGTVTDIGDALELEKAEQELQDEEDEEEEDYDPGSEADSDGEGSSSEEEDAVYGDEEGEAEIEEGEQADDDEDD